MVTDGGVRRSTDDTGVSDAVGFGQWPVVLSPSSWVMVVPGAADPGTAGRGI